MFHQDVVGDGEREEGTGGREGIFLPALLSLDYK